MAVGDDKGPMQGPRSAEEVEKSAAAVVRDGTSQAPADDKAPEAAPTDSATKPVITDQEDA